MILFRTLIWAAVIVAVFAEELELPKNKTEVKPSTTPKPKPAKVGKVSKKKPRQYQPVENMVKFVTADAVPVAQNPYPANYLEEQPKWSRDAGHGHHHNHQEANSYPSTTSTLYYTPTSTTPKYYYASYESKPVQTSSQSYEPKPSYDTKPYEPKPYDSKPYEPKPSYDTKPSEPQPASYSSASSAYEAKPSYSSSSDTKATSYSAGTEYSSPVSTSYSSGSYSSPPAATSYSSYPAPSSSYSSSYNAPQQSYGAPASSYGAPASSYGAPASSYGAPASSYGAPSYDSQPYPEAQYYSYYPAYQRPQTLFPQLHGRKKVLLLLILVPIAFIFIGLPILGLLFSGVSTTNGLFGFGRSVSDQKNTDNWQMLDIVKQEMYNFFLHNIENLEEEKCMERVMCYLGTYAYDVPGKPYVLNVMETMIPDNMSDQFKAFNKAAIYGSNDMKCGEYTCKAIDKSSSDQKKRKDESPKLEEESNSV